MNYQHMASHWYVVFTKPRGESQAAEHLCRQSYDAFFPKIRVNKRLARKVCAIEEAMFPRYIFVRLTPGHDNFAPIRSTRGAIDLVRFGGQPAFVPDGFIELLRSSCQSDLMDLTADTSLQEGQAVEVIDGPFAGAVGVLASVKAQDRVVVLLELLGRPTRVELESHTVQHKSS